MKHKRIILVGKAGSGKDYLRKVFQKLGYLYAVSYTTRPPRRGEEHGTDYFFLAPEKFEGMIRQQLFYEYVTFNGWHYGTTKEQFYRDDIFIMTPHGISCISEEDRKSSLIIFLDIPYQERKSRLELRSDADTVERRLLADEKDFENFTNYDIRITNPDF